MSEPKESPLSAEDISLPIEFADYCMENNIQYEHGAYLLSKAIKYSQQHAAQCVKEVIEDMTSDR